MGRVVAKYMRGYRNGGVVAMQKLARDSEGRNIPAGNDYALQVPKSMKRSDVQAMFAELAQEGITQGNIGGEFYPEE